MDHILLYAFGAIASGISGYLTWLSWKDTRMAFKLIARLDARIDEMGKEIKEIKSKTTEEMLRS
jgi:hypothetical protein